jgi:hypothetical protein
MTSRDYKAIARDTRITLEGINVESGSDEAKIKATEEVISLVDGLAIYFKHENSNFNYDIFTEACGYHGKDTVDYISNPK